MNIVISKTITEQGKIIKLEIVKRTFYPNCKLAFILVSYYHNKRAEQQEDSLINGNFPLNKMDEAVVFYKKVVNYADPKSRDNKELLEKELSLGAYSLSDIKKHFNDYFTIKTNQTKTFIAFHDPCLDGFLSGLLMLDFIKQRAKHNKSDEVDNLVITPVNYNNEPIPAEKGDTILLVDFSYPVEVLEWYIESGVEVIIFDHHKTFIESFTNWKYSGKSKVQGKLAYNDKIKDVEDKRSGAGLVLESVMRFPHTFANLEWLGMDVLKTIMLAESYDLWLHDGDHSRDETYLSFWFKDWRKKNKETFDKLKEDERHSAKLFSDLCDDFVSSLLEDKLKHGKTIVEPICESIRELVKDAVLVKLLEDHPKGVNIGFIPGEKPGKLDISLTGSILVKECGYDVALMEAINKDGKIVYSLRSNQFGKNVNVGEISAKLKEKGLALNGGGHHNAAGFEIKAETKIFKTIE